MKEDIKDQLTIIKNECFKLSQMTGYERMELRYTKQKKFNDSGVLDIYHIQHFFSS